MKIFLNKNTTLGEIENYAKLTLQNVHISFVFDKRNRFPDYVCTTMVVVNDDRIPVKIEIKENYRS